MSWALTKICAWMSTSPGVTSRPRALIVRRALFFGSDAATSTILPPLIATSSWPLSPAPGSRTSPSVTSRSYFIASSPQHEPQRHPTALLTHSPPGCLFHLHLQVIYRSPPLRGRAARSARFAAFSAEFAAIRVPLAHGEQAVCSLYVHIRRNVKTGSAHSSDADLLCGGVHCSASPLAIECRSFVQRSGAGGSDDRGPDSSVGRRAAPWLDPDRGADRNVHSGGREQHRRDGLADHRRQSRRV